MKLFKFDEHIGRFRVLVQTRDIQNGAIVTRLIADGAVDTDKLADGAVTNSKLADKSVTGDKMADKSVSGENIKENTIESHHITAGAVDVTKIKEGTLDGKTIALNSNLIGITTEDNGDIIAWYGSSYGAKVAMEENGDICLISDSEGGDVPYPEPSVIPGDNTVGSEQIVNGSIQMEDLSQDVRDSIATGTEAYYDESSEKLIIGAQTE